MAIKALDLTKTRDFVSRFDDGDPVTVWKIGVLSSRDVGQIKDSVAQISFKKDADGDLKENDVTTSINRSKMNFEAVRRGLKNVENFLDGDGNAVHMTLVTRDVGGGVKKSVVPDKFLEMIPLPVIEELANEIMGDNAPDDEEDDAGNSQEPSSGGSSIPNEAA